jgi:hypothetical protein
VGELANKLRMIMEDTYEFGKPKMQWQDLYSGRDVTHEQNAHDSYCSILDNFKYWNKYVFSIALLMLARYNNAIAIV